MGRRNTGCAGHRQVLDLQTRSPQHCIEASFHLTETSRVAAHRVGCLRTATRSLRRPPARARAPTIAIAIKGSAARGHRRHTIRRSTAKPRSAANRIKSSSCVPCMCVCRDSNRGSGDRGFRPRRRDTHVDEGSVVHQAKAASATSAARRSPSVWRVPLSAIPRGTPNARRCEPL